MTYEQEVITLLQDISTNLLNLIEWFHLLAQIAKILAGTAIAIFIGWLFVKGILDLLTVH